MTDYIPRAARSWIELCLSKCSDNQVQRLTTTWETGPDDRRRSREEIHEYVIRATERDTTLNRVATIKAAEGAGISKVIITCREGETGKENRIVSYESYPTLALAGLKEFSPDFFFTQDGDPWESEEPTIDKDPYRKERKAARNAVLDAIEWVGDPDGRSSPLSCAEFKCLREGMGLTTAWLANRWNVAEYSVKRWERERLPPAEYADDLLALKGTFDAAVDSIRPQTRATVPRTEAESPDGMPAAWHRSIAQHASDRNKAMRISFIPALEDR